MLRGIILMEFLAPDKIANILMANILAVMTHDTFYKTAAVLGVKSEKYYCVIEILLHLTSCFRISKSLLRHGHFCFPRIFKTFKILPKKIGKTGEKKRA